MHSALQHVTSAVDDLVNDYVRVPAPRHADAIDLLDYWRAVVARGDGFVIGRDIPARPIARLLKNLLIHEPLPDGSDTRVRLAGTAVKRRFGSEVHGTMFSDLFPPNEFRHHLAGALDVVRTGVPVVVDSSLKRGALVELHTEIVILPILDRDATTPLLLVGFFYFR